MKISHETPFDLMDHFRAKFNDYDYALVHLFKYPKYKQFFIDSLKMGRIVYLDNSIYELGKSFDPKEFAKIANELSEYATQNNRLVVIAPDVWNDSKETIKNYVRFTTLVNEDIKLMAVLQGISTEELFDCYEALQEDCSLIGVNHMSMAFGYAETSNIVSASNKRIEFVKELNDRARNDGVNIHLLGILLAQEIIKLNSLSNVVSADTSNPVCFGLSYKSYISNGACNEKPVWSIDDWIKENKEMDSLQLQYACVNAQFFKSFII
jgi:hypothetical protein